MFGIEKSPATNLQPTKREGQPDTLRRAFIAVALGGIAGMIDARLSILVIATVSLKVGAKVVSSS
ncbi:MAG: hypothetical protein C0524_06220 [Rhodobacter sp.]|nr:hypothetical protein [Rhodobacter sp.]